MGGATRLAPGQRRDDMRSEEALFCNTGCPRDTAVTHDFSWFVRLQLNRKTDGSSAPHFRSNIIDNLVYYRLPTKTRRMRLARVAALGPTQLKRGRPLHSGAY